MEKLQTLLEQLRAAQDWCDHNGDHGTGYVSLTVDTLQQWENEVIDIIREVELLKIAYETEVAYADAELDV